jgi:hypothetical protein
MLQKILMIAVMHLLFVTAINAQGVPAKGMIKKNNKEFKNGKNESNGEKGVEGRKSAEEINQSYEEAMVLNMVSQTIANTAMYQLPEAQKVIQPKHFTVPSNAINIYNPYVIDINVYVIVDYVVKSTIKVASNNFVSVNERGGCIGLVVCDQEKNKGYAKLLSGSNYELSWDISQKCYTLVPTSYLKHQ